MNTSDRTAPGILLASILLVMVMAATASAKTLVVHRIQAEGFEAGTDTVVTRLLISEMQKLEGVEVPTVPEASCSDKECARQTLEETSADAVVVGSLNRLGSKVILLMEAVWSDQVKSYTVTMEDLGELDRLAPRLADAIVNRTTFEKTVTVETVSAKEEEQQKRIKGDFSWGPSLGVMVPMADSYVDADMLFSIKVPLKYEISRVGIGFETGIDFEVTTEEGHSAVEWPLDLFAMYYISKGSHSPFFGGSFGLHYINVNRELTDDEKRELDEKIWLGKVKYAATGDDKYLVEKPEEHYSEWAPAISAFAGWEFLRTHTAHLAARVGYKYAFVELDDEGAHGVFIDVSLTF